MVKCPNCGYKKIETHYKSWTMKPKSKPKVPKILVKLYVCPNCGHKFRVGERR